MSSAGKNKVLRLILGDQLNPLHSWFSECRDDVVYVLMEIRQETDYVMHHAQKILAIFAGMRELARQLQEAGHNVHYMAIDDASNRQHLESNLDALIRQHRAGALGYQAPDEWRLDQQLARYTQQLAIPHQMVDSEHFFTTRDEASSIFRSRKQWLMEFFYRQMRLKHKVLLDPETGNKQPVGGQWNFDHDNRKPWRGDPPEPADSRSLHDHSTLWATIQAAGIQSFGEPQAQAFRWPVNRTEALKQLDAFIRHALPYFGDYQDAMSSKSFRLFHSLLSFSMNVKLLNPREVVDKVAQSWREGAVPLAAAEGFIRQILGWREYVRGIYWAQMPGYANNNGLEHTAPLPAWFWTGKTNMRCLSHAIGHSLQEAHAHHIERLMVIGNFALLAGLSPQEVHRWYLGIYIDAFEWVELPNTLGMSQYADGGLLATKPYVSSAAYIDRMSDYCKGCHYNKKDRIGEAACPFNALYWDFFARNRERLASNPRIGMVYRQLDKMDSGTIDAFQTQANHLRCRLNAL
jgi:deoxyribodipyrimidine photolyase-related protein